MTTKHFVTSDATFSFSAAGDEDSDVDIPEDEGSDSDIDDGQQTRPHLTRHAHLSGDALL